MENAKSLEGSIAHSCDDTGERERRGPELLPFLK